MSYDPRQGQNPYLDMDLDDFEDYDELSDQFLGDAMRTSQDLSREGLTRRMNASATSAAASYAGQTSIGQPYAADPYDDATRVADPFADQPHIATDSYTQQPYDTYVPEAQPVPKTLRRPSQAPRREVSSRGYTQDLGTPLRREPAYATSQAEPIQAIPSPEQQRPYEPEPSPVPAAVRSHLSGPLAFMLSLPVWAVGFFLRLVAIALSLMVVASTFLTGSLRAQLVGTLNMAPLLMPTSLLGQFVYETPFGGVLRGDLALFSVILFIVDYLCMRLFASLRNRR